MQLTRRYKITHLHRGYLILEDFKRIALNPGETQNGNIRLKLLTQPVPGAAWTHERLLDNLVANPG